MNERHARDALRDVHRVLKRHEARLWLDSGTLLGAVREGTFIPWDDDVDLSVWSDELARLGHTPLWDELAAERFDVYALPDKVVVERDGIPVNISIFHARGPFAQKTVYPLHTNRFNKAVRISYWVFHARRLGGSGASHWRPAASTLAKRVLVGLAERLPESWRRWVSRRTYVLSLAAGCREIEWRIPAGFFAGFETVSFYGDSWMVPADVEGYLAFRYGRDWHTPRTDFSTVDEDGAVVRGSG